MKSRIVQAYETLQEYDFLLPYETAWGFIWTHLDCFADQFRPTYVKHLKPFEPYRFNTFFYIDDIRKFLNRSMSERTMKESGIPNITLAVLYIFLVAVEDEIVHDLMWANETKEPFVQLANSYRTDNYYLSEISSPHNRDDIIAPQLTVNVEESFIIDNRIKKLIINDRFLWQYDLPTDRAHDNMIVFTNNLL